MRFAVFCNWRLQTARACAGNKAKMKQKIITTALAVICAAGAFAGTGLSFDVGTEPEQEGNVSYGMVQYGWSDEWASRADVRYGTHTDTDGDIPGYGSVVETVQEQTIEVDLLPLVRYFGRGEENDAGMAREFSISAGLSYQYTHRDDFAGMFDINGLMLDPVDEGRYFTMSDEKTAHIFAPRIGFTARVPLAGFCCINFEGFAHPFYYLHLVQDMSYYSAQASTPFDYSGSNSIGRFSSPYFDARLSADILGYVRLLARFTYQRLNFQQMDWAADLNSLTGYDDVQTKMCFRAGIELLSWNRISARLRAGIFREQSWNKSSYTGETEKDGKWVLSIGSEL